MDIRRVVKGTMVPLKREVPTKPKTKKSQNQKPRNQ